MMMIFREAQTADIPGIQVVRHLVKENTLSDPALVPDIDVADYINNRGKGWVCEMDNVIIAFAIVSVKNNNVWALFVHPDFDRKGIGKRLHDDMMEWYFNQTDAAIWLSTSPNTRAEKFYRKAGWKEAGKYGKGEIKFEMTPADWMETKSIK